VLSLSVFFATLSDAVPKLKTLLACTDMRIAATLEFNNALMSYSKNLTRLSLAGASHKAISDCLAPFRTEHFDSYPGAS